MPLFFLLIAIPTLLAIWAQARVSSAFSKYGKIRCASGLSGRQVAERILEAAGIYDVRIEHAGRFMGDHYDPATKCLRLSPAHCEGNSLTAIGVAAHEAGHALQHKAGYSMLKLRSSLVPLTSVASNVLPFVVFGGLIMGSLGLVKLGVLVYLVLTAFQLVTLPVEWDASRRARGQLKTLGLVQTEEEPAIRETLNAAGYTYLAAFVGSLANLLFFFAASRRN